MNVRIELAKDQHDQLLQLCAPGSVEHRILMAACIDVRKTGDRIEQIVEIDCELKDVRQLIELTKHLPPNLRDEIAKILSSSR
jgi:hypothetical protein